MSSPNPIELLEDRIKFKFFAVDEKLQQLKRLDSSIVTLDAEARVKWEILTEDLLAHLVGAIDALLAKINEKFGFGLKRPDLNNLKDKLRSRQKSDLLKEVCDLLDRDLYPDGSWLTDLYELRNIGMHRSILNLGHNAGNAQKTFVGDKSGLDVNTFLQDRIQKMKDLIKFIIDKDPLL